MNRSEHKSPDSSADLHDWARGTLGLSSAVNSADAVVPILERLAGVDFVPPRSWQDAIDVLIPDKSHGPDAVPIDYYHNHQFDARLEIERFASDFFDLQLSVRREWWKQLNHLCAPWPPLRLWLLKLKPGLNVELPTSDSNSTNMEQFGRFLKRRFVECPGQRILEDWELAITEGDQKEWQSVAQKYQRQFPRFARLFAPWVEEFATYSTTIERIRRKELISHIRNNVIPKIFLIPDTWPYLSIIHYMAIAVAIVVAMIGYTKQHSVGTSRPTAPLARASQQPGKSTNSARQQVQDVMKLIEFAMESKEPPDVANIKRLGNRVTEEQRQRLRLHEQMQALALQHRNETGARNDENRTSGIWRELFRKAEEITKLRKRLSTASATISAVQTAPDAQPAKRPTDAGPNRPEDRVPEVPLPECV